MTQGTTLTDAAKARASFYAFLNIHFTELPDESFMTALRNQAFDSALKELGAERESSPGNRCRGFTDAGVSGQCQRSWG